MVLLNIVGFFRVCTLFESHLPVINRNRLRVATMGVTTFEWCEENAQNLVAGESEKRIESERECTSKCEAHTP